MSAVHDIDIFMQTSVRNLIKINYNILLQGSLNIVPMRAMTYKNNITHSFDIIRLMMIHMGQMNFYSTTV